MARSGGGKGGKGKARRQAVPALVTVPELCTAERLARELRLSFDDLVAKAEGQAMVITKKDILDFFTNAPGVLLAMLHTQFVMPTDEAQKTAVLAAEEEAMAKRKELTKRNSIAEDDEDENGESGDEEGV